MLLILQNVFLVAFSDVHWVYPSGRVNCELARIWFATTASESCLPDIMPTQQTTKKMSKLFAAFCILLALVPFCFSGYALDPIPGAGVIKIFFMSPYASSIVPNIHYKKNDEQTWTPIPGVVRLFISKVSHFLC